MMFDGHCHSCLHKLEIVPMQCPTELQMNRSCPKAAPALQKAMKEALVPYATCLTWHTLSGSCWRKAKIGTEAKNLCLFNYKLVFRSAECLPLENSAGPGTRSRLVNSPLLSVMRATRQEYFHCIT